MGARRGRVGTALRGSERLVPGRSGGHWSPTQTKCETRLPNVFYTVQRRFTCCSLLSRYSTVLCKVYFVLFRLLDSLLLELGSTYVRSVRKDFLQSFVGSVGRCSSDTNNDINKEGVKRQSVYVRCTPVSDGRGPKGLCILVVLRSPPTRLPRSVSPRRLVVRGVKCGLFIYLGVRVYLPTLGVF